MIEPGDTRPGRSGPQHARMLLLAGTLAVLAIVAVVYWPVLDAGFVWDGIALFQQNATLYVGDTWKEYLLTGFNQWSVYFRPVGVALFVWKARAFAGDAAAMHALSLVVVLINVGLLIAVARAATTDNWRLRTPMALLAGLLYGLHPMLVATVTWIACHDQTLVLMMLAGLLASLSIRRPWPRAILVSLLFLCAMMTKESAIAFPVFVVLLDWVRRADRQLPVARRLRHLLRQNWPVYLSLFVTGLVYLLLRQWALASAIPEVVTATRLPDLVRLERIAWLYLKYWSITLGIPTGVNPLHAIGSIGFGQHAGMAWLRIGGALAILAIGLLVLSRRFVATGAVVLAATIYLVPFLGILPVTFDKSLYHERYAIGAIAMLVVLLPALVHEWLPLLQNTSPLLARWLPAIPLLWLAMAIPNVRATIPLWSDNVALWKWAVQGNPNHPKAHANLINAYLVEGRHDEAEAATRTVLAADLDCPLCYVNGLVVAVRQGDPELASTLNGKIRSSAELLAQDPRMQHYYFRAMGRLALRRGDPVQAVRLLTRSIEREDLEPLPHILLAEALMATGNPNLAQQHARLAVSMSREALRAAAQGTADRILAGEVVFGEPMNASPESGSPIPPGSSRPP